MRRLLATAVLAAGLTLGAQAAQAASPAPSLSPDLGYAGSSTGILVRALVAAAQVSGTAADAANDRLLAVGTSENAGATHDILSWPAHADGSFDRGYQGGEFTLPSRPATTRPASRSPCCPITACSSSAPSSTTAAVQGACSRG